MLARLLDASYGTGVSPSEVPELVAAYVVEEGAKGRSVTSDQAKREIRRAEILSFGLDGRNDFRPRTQVRKAVGLALRIQGEIDVLKEPAAAPETATGTTTGASSIPFITNEVSK